MSENESAGPVLHSLQIVTGQLQENCHALWRDGRQEALLFDPGDEAEMILRTLAEKGLRPGAILQTHCHGDHIGAIGDIKAKFPDAPLHVHEAERTWLSNPLHNLSYFTMGPVSAPDPDVELKGGEVLTFPGLELRVIHIPGHSPGGVAYFAEDPGGGPPHVYVGDILFQGSIGRTDFPGSEGAPALIKGIREKLFTLPGNTIVHTGHGPDTTIAAENAHNPFCGMRA